MPGALSNKQTLSVNDDDDDVNQRLVEIFI